MANALSGTNFCSVQYEADNLSSAASAAYWLQHVPHEQAVSHLDHHRREIRARMDRLAELMGLRLVDEVS